MISSRSNPLFRKFLSLTESKGLKKEGFFLLSGKNLIFEFLKNPSLEIEAEITTKDLKPLSPSSPQMIFSPSLFDELDVLGTHSPLLVLKQPLISDWNFSQCPAGLHLLLPLGDPGNLGAVIRSAEAFGVQNLILLKEAAHPFLPKAVKASAGSCTRLKLWRGPSLRELPAGPIWALDRDGENLSQTQWPQAAYLLVGEEGAGLPENLKVKKISIPIQASVESLNATVAVSIALYAHSQWWKSLTKGQAKL